MYILSIQAYMYMLNKKQLKYRKTFAELLFESYSNQAIHLTSKSRRHQPKSMLRTNANRM